MNDQSTAYHYNVIARAMEEIDRAGPGLTLDDLAGRMRMSPAHFQRVFSAWVGVSPKRYQQYLTLDHARRMLAGRQTTMETALATGLSGTGRLHDLFTAWEAMSPGDYARGAEGLTVFWGWQDSPFGPALVMGTARGLCGIAFAAEVGEEAAFADLVGRWPRANFVEDPMMLRPGAQAAFGASANGASGNGGGANGGSANGGGPPVYLIGAPFQIKVWEALVTVPTGQVTTYGEIAQAIGHPTAIRAVGTAVGRNPIGWLIPCHRAIRKTGGLGGYHWGLPVKRAMLAYEAARAEA